MNTSSDKKKLNVVITGASKGMGKAMAMRFAAGGHNVFLCSRGELGLYKTMEELMNLYPDVTIKAKPFDLSNTNAAKEFAAWCLSHATPDVLINNAGSFVPGSVYNEEEGFLEKMIEGNLYCAYHVTRGLLPKMMENKNGRIINICSIAALKAYDNGGSYSISKAAMLSFSKNLREEMKPHGIKVTAVMPGAVYTDSWAASGIDENRFMPVEDIAETIYSITQLSDRTVVEEIILRPQLGDI
jgi:short-subunit dehydrogenase